MRHLVSLGNALPLIVAAARGESDRALAHAERREWLQDALRSLMARPVPRPGHPSTHARQARVLSLLYGLDGGSERTFTEVARMFGCGIERVRQLAIQGIANLRRLLAAPDPRPLPPNTPRRPGDRVGAFILIGKNGRMWRAYCECGRITNINPSPTAVSAGCLACAGLAARKPRLCTACGTRDPARFNDHVASLCTACDRRRCRNGSCTTCGASLYADGCRTCVPPAPKLAPEPPPPPPPPAPLPVPQRRPRVHLDAALVDYAQTLTRSEARNVIAHVAETSRTLAALRLKVAKMERHIALLEAIPVAQKAGREVRYWGRRSAGYPVELPASAPDLAVPVEVPPAPPLAPPANRAEREAFVRVTAPTIQALDSIARVLKLRTGQDWTRATVTRWLIESAIPAAITMVGDARAPEEAPR